MTLWCLMEAGALPGLVRDTSRTQTELTGAQHWQGVCDGPDGAMSQWTCGAVSWSHRAAVMSERGCVTAQSGVCEVTDGAVTSQSLLCEVIEQLWHHRGDCVTSQSRL